MNQKGFINILLIVIIVALIGAGAYFVSTRQITSPIPSLIPGSTLTPSPTPPPTLKLTPTPAPTPASLSTPNETASWKVYHNDAFGFEMKYPPKFVKETSEEYTSAHFTIPKTPYTSESININIQRKKLDPGNIKGLWGATVNAKTVQIANQVGYQYSQDDGAGCIGSGVQTPYGNNTLEINFISCENKPSQIFKDIGLQTKVIETLRFFRPFDPLLVCLPSERTLVDIVSVEGANKATVVDKLHEIGGHCSFNEKLLDKTEKQIYFYELHDCWGNPPSDYREILQKQQDEINKLKEQYTVIEMTCNPSGILPI